MRARTAIALVLIAVAPLTGALAQEQQQAAQMQKVAQAEQMSKTAKNLAGSPLDEDSALKQMLEGANT